MGERERNLDSSGTVPAKMNISSSCFRQWLFASGPIKTKLKKQRCRYKNTQYSTNSPMKASKNQIYIQISNKKIKNHVAKPNMFTPKPGMNRKIRFCTGSILSNPMLICLVTCQQNSTERFPVILDFETSTSKKRYAHLAVITKKTSVKK